MTSDERVTVRLDPELAEKLRSEENASAIVRKVLDAYYSNGQRKIGVLETRIDEIREERTRLQNREDKLREEQKRLQAQLDDLKPDVEEIVNRAEPYVKGVSNPENPAVLNWADKAGIAPSELLERVNGNGGGSH